MGEEKTTKGICKVCKGPIVELFGYKHEHNSDPRGPLYGPGLKKAEDSNKPPKVSKGFYCKKCGIKYQFIPD